MQTLLERTSRVDQKLAQSAISKYQVSSDKIVNTDKNSVRIKFQQPVGYLTLPKKALHLLFEILANMAQGKSITLIPSDSVVSTQQAADMLNVSRPHLVKLLEQGEIPFKKAGSHRRIELKDIISYQRRLEEIRKEKLNFLAKQAQELNLGY